MISVCVEEEKDGRVADATFNLSFYTKHKNVTVKCKLHPSQKQGCVTANVTTLQASGKTVITQS